LWVSVLFNTVNLAGLPRFNGLIDGPSLYSARG